jgi:imidazolonepropionase-like amidohydrolase
LLWCFGKHSTPPKRHSKVARNLEHCSKENAGMKSKKQHPRLWLYGLIGLVIVYAILISAWLFLRNQNSEQTTAFTHVNLIPMTSEKVIEDQTVLVRGTEIVALGESGKSKIPWGAQVIDGKGAYLMPGLADMHAHTRNSTGQWAQPWEDPEIWPVHPLKLYLANGVTTIRDLSAMDESGAYPLQLREEIREGTRVGPTIYTAGESLYASPLGDPVGLVDQNHEHGFDLLKIMPYLSADDFQAVMREAKKLGTYTIGHIPYAVGLEATLAAGMDEIAHVENLDYELMDFDRDKQLSEGEWDSYVIQETFLKVELLPGQDPLADFKSTYAPRLEEIANELKTAGVPVDTTMDVGETFEMKVIHPEKFLARPESKFLDPKYLDTVRRGKEYHQNFCRDIKKLCAAKYDLDRWILAALHDAGVELVLGTDAIGGIGIVPGFSIHDELRILVENGFTPYEALLTGTVNAAGVVEKMTGEGNFGTIEVGKRADLILVRRNPLEDINTIREPLGVMAAGRWYSSEQLSKLIEISGSSE